MTQPSPHFPYRAHVHTYPFWMYVDPEFPESKAVQANMGSVSIRIYRPFRSGDANTLPFPPLKIDNVPHAKWLNPDGSPYVYESTVIVPVLKMDSREVVLLQSPDHTQLPSVKPMDSLRYDIYGHMENDAEFQINRRIIEAIRFRSGQWWIGKTVEGIVGFGTGISFEIDDNGRPLGPPAHLLDVSGEFLGGETPITLDILGAAANDLSNGHQPPISDVLLLDAKYHLASRDFRRFVIDAATACEYIKDDTFIRLWGARHSTPFERDRVLGRWDISRHLDVKLNDNFGISYKTTFPHYWEEIRDLWDARGNVSHGASCGYGTPLVEVEREKAITMLKAVVHCMGWLKSLS